MLALAALSFLCYRPAGSFVVSPRRVPSPRRSSGRVASSRVDQFWREVAFGLADQFQFKDIPRVLEFSQYARGEKNAPAPQAQGHEPCEEFVPGLTAKPFWDPTEFSWVAELEAQSGVIQEELQSVKVSSEGASFSGDSALQSSVMGGGWSAIRLQRLGRWNEDMCQLFPKTAGILRKLDIPYAVRGVMFARQTPKTAVAAHSDGRNFILTCHLGLKVPSECWIQVAGERSPWEEGKAMVIDTSFVHETANQSDDDRFVLIIDFWHPELTTKEQGALQLVYDIRYEFDKGVLQAAS